MKIFEDYLEIVEELKLENELDEENLEEAKFEYGGSTYSVGFGRYKKDGKEITRDEYKKAFDAYKGSKKINKRKTSTTKSSKEEPKEEPKEVTLQRMRRLSPVDKKKREKEYLKKQRREPEPSDDIKRERNRLKFLMKEYLRYKNSALMRGREIEPFSSWSERMRKHFFKDK